MRTSPGPGATQPFLSNALPKQIRWAIRQGLLALGVGAQAQHHYERAASKLDLTRFQPAEPALAARTRRHHWIQAAYRQAGIGTALKTDSSFMEKFKKKKEKSSHTDF